VTAWVTHVDPDALEFSPVILNVVFIGDADRHEAEIREFWSGPRAMPFAQGNARPR
jgi:hypothetical protein